MSADASALLVTADKALARELARLRMVRKLSLSVGRRTLYNKLEEHGLE